MDASQLLCRYAAGETDFRAAQLREANLSRTNLSGANFSDADLRKANLARSKLIGANLIRANLSGANLSGANCIRVNLSGANLWGANLSDSDLRRADLRGADLRGADLLQAKLRGADLRGADLQGADLSKVNLTGTDLRGSNFSRTYLSRANLTRANLGGADLRGADLRGVTLTQVRAIAANFEGATLTGACLEDWQIDRETNFHNVICDYVYLKEDQQERRPKNLYETFRLGQFAQLFQKYCETVDFLFPDGIDWHAFLLAFEQLQQEYDGKLLLRAMAYENDGTFAIGIDIPPDTDKVGLEKSFEEKYQRELKQVENSYRLELKAREPEIENYKHQNTHLLGIVKLLASKQVRMQTLWKFLNYY